MISASATLTIQPGVTVKLADQASIIAEGALKAQGTIDNFVKFTKKGFVPWGNIQLLGRGMLKYCLVEYSYPKSGVQASVILGSNTAKVENCLIKNNYEGIGIIGNPISPVIKNNTILNARHGIIALGLSYPTVTNNIAVGNTDTGIEANNVSTVVTYNNSQGNANADFLIRGNASVPLTNLSINPQFADAANGDYRLKSTSPLLTAGEGGTQMGVYGP